MVTAHKVDAQINETINVADRAFNKATSQAYEILSLDIRKLEALAREAFQGKLDELLWPVLQKLEDGEDLTSAERDMLQLLVVGEARYYVKSENDVENWQNEVKRLLDEVQQLQAAGLDEVDALMQVRARCREALRVVPDLAFYYREQERVRKFEESMAGAVDADTRRLLANLIKDMISSDKL